jgi:hypothetical protein
MPTTVMKLTSVIVAALVATALAGCRFNVDTRPRASGDAAADGKWVRTELYFGLSRAGADDVSEEQWRRFVETHITPRFLDGFTVVSAEGWWQDRGQVTSESSRLVIVLHPPSVEADLKLDAVAREYARQFGQNAVLRSDAPADVAFIGAHGHSAGAPEATSGGVTTRPANSFPPNGPRGADPAR